MQCPICGSSEAWVRGKVRSQQEGYWIRTFVECPRCSSSAEVRLNLDGRDQVALVSIKTDITSPLEKG